jgi:hypothetical protein
MSSDQHRRWCLFTSAGDRNSIHLWFGNNAPRRWDLVVAYYGDDDRTFSDLSKLSSYAFRSKGSKFQNLKKLLVQDSRFFDRYSHVWVCDDDIIMSAAQINEAFVITETLGFWVAQPACRPEGKNTHWITVSAQPQWDYRIVNYVEVQMPIFRRDKLAEFLAVYDGSLTGWGIEHWFAHLFGADEFGRFAIIDKVQVMNPHDEMKGGSEIDRLQTAQLRRAAWHEVREKYELVEYPDRVIAYCKFAPETSLLINNLTKTNRFVRNWERIFVILETLRHRGWRDAIWMFKCGLTIRRQLRACWQAASKCAVVK